MNPNLQNALQEAYARRTGGGQMPQPGQTPMPQQPAPQPAAAPVQSSFSGGTEGIPQGSGVSIDPNLEVEKIAAKALAKRLNSAGKVA